MVAATRWEGGDPRRGRRRGAMAAEHLGRRGRVAGRGGDRRRASLVTVETEGVGRGGRADKRIRISG